MLRKALVIAVVLAMLTILVAGTALAAGDAANGKTVWAAKLCKNCHGANGEGKYAGPEAGTTLAAADWLKETRTPAAHMPAFSATQITDQDVADMQAYMATLTKPASFTPIAYTAAATDLPGKVLFNQNECVACHGADPTNFYKGRFNDKGRAFTSAAVLKQLRTPAANMPMFSATQVTDAQSNQIGDYITSLLAPFPVVTTPVTATVATTATTTTAPATTLPKTGDQFPVVQMLLAGLALIGLAVAAGAVARRSA